MLAKLLDPKNDVAFQKIFGSEQHKTVLIHLINDILEFKGDKKIEQVEFLKTIQDPDIAIKKQSVVDVLCKDIRGTQYIIEMQVAKKPGALNSVLNSMLPKPMVGKPIEAMVTII